MKLSEISPDAWIYFGIALIVIISLLFAWLFDYVTDLWIYLGIAFIASLPLLLAWLFDFLNKKKTSEFFEKVAEWIKDFLT